MTSVLHVYAGNLYGGIEAMLVTLARQALASGTLRHEFALAFDGRLARELREAGARVTIIGSVRRSLPWTGIGARRRLGRLIRASGTRVVVCHAAWSAATFGRAAARGGVPLVFWQHDAATGQSAVERAARKRVHPRFALCNSRFTRGTLPAIFPGIPSAVVHCPVPAPPAFSPSARAEARAELQTPGDHVVIAQTSRMEAWKGQRRHLRALAALRDLPGWTCWLAGGAQRPHEAAYLRGLRAQAAELGIADRVRFAGERADIPRFLAAADVLCQPNESPEPFGISLVEALYAGLPVVTTARGGATEVVDASCGVLTAPGDDAGVADALRRLVTDAALRTALGAAGPARAAAVSGPAARLAEVEEALAAVVAGGTA